jgi:hypothetical protein
MEIKFTPKFTAQLKLVEPSDQTTKEETCQEQTDSQIFSQTPSSES